MIRYLVKSKNKWIWDIQSILYFTQGINSNHKGLLHIIENAYACALNPLKAQLKQLSKFIPASLLIKTETKKRYNIHNLCNIRNYLSSRFRGIKMKYFLTISKDSYFILHSRVYYNTLWLKGVIHVSLFVWSHQYDVYENGQNSLHEKFLFVLQHIIIHSAW